MTRQRQHGIKCWFCDNEVSTCPSCGSPLMASSPFSEWFRQLPKPFDSSNFATHNLDYVWHNYNEHWFITIEEKMFGRNVSDSQHQTHAIVSEMLKVGSKIPIAVPEMRNGNSATVLRPYEYRGHYVIKFQQTNPMDSDWCYINGSKFENDDVVIAILLLLRTGQIPVTTASRFYQEAAEVAAMLRNRDKVPEIPA